MTHELLMQELERLRKIEAAAKEVDRCFAGHSHSVYLEVPGPRGEAALKALHAVLSMGVLLLLLTLPGCSAPSWYWQGPALAAVLVLVGFWARLRWGGGWLKINGQVIDREGAPGWWREDQRPGRAWTNRHLHHTLPAAIWAALRALPLLLLLCAPAHAWDDAPMGWPAAAHAETAPQETLGEIPPLESLEWWKREAIREAHEAIHCEAERLRLAEQHSPPARWPLLFLLPLGVLVGAWGVGLFFARYNICLKWYQSGHITASRWLATEQDQPRRRTLPGALADAWRLRKEVPRG